MKACRSHLALAPRATQRRRYLTPLENLLMTSPETQGVLNNDLCNGWYKAMTTSLHSSSSDVQTQNAHRTGLSSRVVSILTPKIRTPQTFFEHNEHQHRNVLPST